MRLSLCFLTDLTTVSPGMVNKAYTDAPVSLQLGLHLTGPFPRHRRGGADPAPVTTLSDPGP